MFLRECDGFRINERYSLALDMLCSRADGRGHRRMCRMRDTHT